MKREQLQNDTEKDRLRAQLDREREELQRMREERDRFEQSLKDKASEYDAQKKAL